MFGELRSLMHRLRERGEALSHLEDHASADRLLAFYTRIMARVTGAERCSIFINDIQNDKVWLKVGTDVVEHEIEVPREGSVAGQVITSGEPVIVSDIDPASEASRQALEKTGFVTRNMLCVPIRSSTRNEIAGAFQLLNKRDAGTFTEEDMADALEIAGHMQDQVDRVFLSQEISGITDHLYDSINKAISYLIGAMGVLIFLTAFVLFGGYVVIGT